MSSFRSRTTGRAILVAFALVVVSFTTATLISQRGGKAIETAADGIISNSAPNLDHLSYVSSELRHLEVLLGDWVDDVVAGRPGGQRWEIANLIERVDREWREYRRQPSFPEETELWPAVEQERKTLDTSVRRLLAELEKRGAGSQAILDREVKPSIDRLDQQLVQLRVLNRERGVALAERIRILGRRSTVTALILDAVSVVLTLVAAWMLVSAVSNYQRRLQERADELEMFAGRVAHDILSPLSVAGMSFQALQKLDLAAKAETPVARGLRAVHRVENLVDALLQFARAGARPEPGAETDVGAVLHDVMEERAPSASEARIELRVEPFAPCKVACSSGALTSVVSNLIGNAIKYAGEVPVRRVTARVLPVANRVRIEVEDTGPGLPPALLQRAFEPYVRGDNNANGGIGLGLATVKRIVETHGGEVGVRSEPGLGCLFWFELERPQPPEHTPVRT